MRHRPLEPFARPFVKGPVGPEQEFLLVGKIMRDDRGAEANLGGDPAHRRRFQPFARNQPDRDLGDRTTTFIMITFRHGVQATSADSPSASSHSGLTWACGRSLTIHLTMRRIGSMPSCGPTRPGPLNA